MMANQGVGTDACLIWHGSRDKDGYGVQRINGKRYRAHRVALEAKLGRPLGAQMALHSCDNASCVNPNHLRAGDAADNATDKVCRERQCRGEASHLAKLTEAQVLEIRARYVRQSSEHGTTAIAKDYGVSQTMVSDLLRRRTWKHL